jgi:hypothetical protein
MNQENNKAAKKVWNTPVMAVISVEETLSGRYPLAFGEDAYYIS